MHIEHILLALILLKERQLKVTHYWRSVHAAMRSTAYKDTVNHVLEMFHRGTVSSREVRVIGIELASQLAVSRARQNLMATGPMHCIPDYSIVVGKSVPRVRTDSLPV